jgi:hypothetical protein
MSVQAQLGNEGGISCPHFFAPSEEVKIGYGNINGNINGLLGFLSVIVDDDTNHGKETDSRSQHKNYKNHLDIPFNI